MAQKINRANWRKEGKCVECGSPRPSVAGWSSPYCAPCRERGVERKRKARAEKKAAHRCYHCNGQMPREWKKAKCQRCLTRAFARREALRAERTAAGLCTDCGKPAAAPGRRLCAKHAEVGRKAASALHERRMAAGKCRDCGSAEPRPGKRSCAECAADNRRYEILTKRDRVAAGLCARCGKCPNEDGTRNCRPCRAAANGKRAELRSLVLDHYGGKCACCGESEWAFLHIDHINDDGAEHRRRDSTAAAIYNWLRKNDFPPGFQVLCANCNLAKYHYGVCPHQRKRDAAAG